MVNATRWCSRLKKEVDAEYCKIKCGYYFNHIYSAYVKCYWNFEGLPFPRKKKTNETR